MAAICITMLICSMIIGAFIIEAANIIGKQSRKVEKKLKWTLKDEDLYQNALDAFEALDNNLNPSVDWEKLYDWLKLLKKRIEQQ